MASLTYAINWIAENDECAEEDASVMADLISVLLVADMFGKEPIEIARRVIKRRRDVGILGPVSRSAA